MTKLIPYDLTLCTKPNPDQPVKAWWRLSRIFVARVYRDGYRAQFISPHFWADNQNYQSEPHYELFAVCSSVVGDVITQYMWAHR